MNRFAAIVPNKSDGVGVLLGKGSLILTESGARPVQKLKRGDLVITRDHGAQPIRMVLRQEFSAEEIQAENKFVPLRIQAGAFGENLPSRNCHFAQDSYLLVQQGEEKLTKAKNLKHLRKVALATGKRKAPVAYYGLLLDRPELLFVNNIAVESFYPSEAAIQNLNPKQLIKLADALEHANMTKPNGSIVPRAREVLDRHALQDILNSPDFCVDRFFPRP